MLTQTKFKSRNTVHLARATIGALRTSPSPINQTPPTEGQRLYRPYGTAKDLLYSHAAELVLSGPAGTGKTRACLEKMYLCAALYPGMRGLIVRKTRESLKQTVIVTWETRVLPVVTPVYFHTTDNEYRFPNGSVIVVGGLDKPSRVMSSEYDMIYAAEATEFSEDDIEALTTRLRNGVMPFQQLIMDCNPGAPYHWLKKRADIGKTIMLESRHEDNPTVTDEYLARLDTLTGARYLRLRKGIWAAAEGMVYDEWDPAIHLIDRFDIPKEWPRYRSLDFGYTNPFTCSWYAMDPDGRLFMYREIYMTGRLVEDHATDILRLSEGERIEWTTADHDAEDRATLERRGIHTRPAKKDVSPGIQAVAARLRKAGDGKSRLFILRDSLVERDRSLVEKRKPTCTAEEFEGYVWQQSADGKPLKEQPLKADDHGMDGLRYMVMGHEISQGWGANPA